MNVFHRDMTAAADEELDVVVGVTSPYQSWKRLRPPDRSPRGTRARREDGEVEPRGPLARVAHLPGEVTDPVRAVPKSSIEVG